jgi:hypothetical protein
VIYGVLVMRTKSRSRVNVQGFCMVVLKALDINRSDNGLSIGPEIVTLKIVTVLCKTVC